MTTGYTEIPIKRDAITVEFEENEPTVVDTAAVEDVTLAEAVKVEAPAIEVPTTSAKPKEQSRAQKRIRQLSAEKQDALSQLEQMKKDKLELERKLIEGSKHSKTSMKDTLDSQVKMLSSNLKEAIQNGDAELAVSLQNDLINAKMELASINYDLKTTESVVKTESVEEKKISSAPVLPEAAIVWIEEHPAFSSDELFRVSAITVNNQLLREGWDLETDEFYEELNKRLSKRFPEAFVIAEQKGVESKNDKKTSVDNQEDVKDKVSKARSVEQTVSGSSRPSSVAVNSSIKKTSVQLTADDVAQAEEWGISLEQMARRIAHASNNKRVDGYVPIVISK